MGYLLFAYGDFQGSVPTDFLCFCYNTGNFRIHKERLRSLNDEDELVGCCRDAADYFRMGGVTPRRSAG